MTQPATTLLSVRGEATLAVAPDEAEVNCSVAASAHDRRASVNVADERLRGLVAALADRGGTVRTAETLRAALTWSASGMSTHEEFDGGKVTTGTYRTAVGVRVFLRDLGRLHDLVAALSGLDGFELWGIQWSVDDDNAAWSQVRADAIRSAFRRGADYARALGGQIVAVEHIADAGLLGAPGEVAARAVSYRGARGEQGMSLDPEPQQLSAVIDARFLTTVGADILGEQGS
jgi:uncharacterized protein YggE